MSFQPSINITYDIGKSDLFEQYVPNVKQLSIMEAILQNLIFEKQHANIIVGPYGAGKSLVATMLTSLLTQRTNKKEFKQFFEDVHTVAPTIGDNIKNIILEKEYRWLPITITGKTGDFENIILENIKKQCNAQNIEITLKHDAAYILELISSWKTNFTEAYGRFNTALHQQQLTIEQFIIALQNNDENTVQKFKEVYPTIVYGTSFHNPKKLEFIEQIEFIFEQLEKKKIALFIVFDEFGRFLQTIFNHKIYETMQAIQSLAELANRRANMGLLLITHTGLQQYSTNNKDLSKDELERVEKRFTEYRLESDSAIFYRSAYKLLSKNERAENLFLSPDYEDLNYFIMKYNLFSDMTKDEIDGAIIAGCQPIHPLTIQLLPAISNQLGQNDRTLYMFLNQFDTSMVRDNWYYADQLFDYFYPDESILLTLNTMKYYRMAMKYNLSANAVRFVKLTTLFSLINTPFPINKTFMKFALGITEQQIEHTFTELLDAKMLRMNPFTKSYELYEGSLVEVEALVHEVSITNTVSEQQRCNALQEIFNEPFYIPLGYNTSKSMTRFIKSSFNFGIPNDLEFKNNNDGELIYILTSSQREKDELAHTLESYTEDDKLLAIVDLDVTEITNELDMYLTLERMLKTPELMQQDVNLKKEVEIRLETAKYKIKQFMHPVKQLENNTVTFYFEGRIETITSKQQFEKFLDFWMYKRFPYTPEIRNESFNKNNIMGVQKKAALSILNQILSPTFNGQFTISGNGPDYLIYATTFKNTQFNFHNLDAQTNPAFKMLREHLLQVLEISNRNSISELFNIALLKPFGIRKPLVPLLVVALLKDKWHQMAFYSKDFSIPEMTAEMLYDIFEHEATYYEFEIYHLENEVLSTLEHLNLIYCENQSLVHPQVVFKDLRNWLLNLPRFTQITEKQSDKTKMFKQVIRASESDPILGSTQIQNLHYTLEDFKAIKRELNTFIDQFKTHLINETLKCLQINHKDELKTKHEQLILSSPQFLQVAAIFEKDNFIDELILKIVGVPLEDWSDITYDSYCSTLKQLLVKNEDDVIQILEGNQVVNTIKEVDLSVKGKTIYTQIERIVTSGGRTMNSEEVKYILYH